MCVCVTWPVKCTAMPGQTCQLISYWYLRWLEKVHGGQRVQHFKVLETQEQSHTLMNEDLQTDTPHTHTHGRSDAQNTHCNACSASLATIWDFCVCTRRRHHVFCEQEGRGGEGSSFSLCLHFYPSGLGGVLMKTSTVWQTVLMCCYNIVMAEVFFYLS